MNFKTLFHYISYLQYPLMLIGLYFAFKPYLLGIEQLRENPDLIFKNLNSLLIFMGLGVSFSSLQDTTKTQNKFSEKIWKNPKKGKLMIASISLMILFFLTFGLIGYYFAKVGVLKELSIGIIVLGLGMFGFLKAAIEMFENHRTDKK
jgi:magnesium-transporting ATPase (P-type)